MESTYLSSSTIFSPLICPKMKICGKKRGSFAATTNTTSSTTRTFAARREAHDQNYGGSRLVDENMIVLRKRIHEMKMVERNYEPPSEWTEWEKRYFTSYDSLICEMVGVLQSQLMNTRPSLALGIITLISLSVPTSTAVLFSHLMEMMSRIQF